jgi:O-antigen ligase
VQTPRGAHAALEKGLLCLARGAVLAAPLTVLAANDVLAPDIWFDLTAWKCFAFRILVEVACGAWLVLAVLSPAHRPRFSWPLAAAAALAAATTASDLLGVDPHQSLWSNLERMEGLVGLLHLLAFLAVAGTVLDEKLWKLFFHVSLACCTFVCAEAVAQYFGAPLLYRSAESGFRLDARLGSPVYLGIYVQLHVFLAAVYFARAESAAARLPYAALAALFVAVLYGTGTRAAWLGTLAGLGLAAALLALRAPHAAVRRAAVWAGAIAAALVMALLLVVIIDPQFLRGVPALGRLHRLAADASTRLLVWDIAWRGFLDRPLLGFGEYNFSYVFDRWFDPRLFGEGRWWDHPHDVFLGWLVAGGVLGFAAQMALWSGGAAALWSRRAALPTSDRALLIGALLGYLLFHATQPEYPPCQMLAYAVLGYAHAHAVAHATPARGRRGRPLAALAVAALAAIAAGGVALAVAQLNVRNIRAAAALLDGTTPPVARQSGSTLQLEIEPALDPGSFVVTEARERLATLAVQIRSSGDAPELERLVFERAIEEVTADADRHPQRVRAQYVAGLLLNQANQPARALVYLERARASSPKRQFLWFEIAASHRQLGQAAKAVQIAREAYLLCPENRRALSAFAMAAIDAGDGAAVDEAIALLRPRGRYVYAAPPKLVDAVYQRGLWKPLIALLEPIVAEGRRKRSLGLRAPNPTIPALRLITAYAGAGRGDDARALLDELVRWEPRLAARRSAWSDALRRGALREVWPQPRQR